MANSTDPFAETVHGTNPQYLIEKITRLKIYNSVYWKEECFGLTAETIIDKAIALKYCGGVFGGNIQPTKFLCLVLKLLQLQPDREIVLEYIKNEDFKYLRVLGAFYIRLTYKVEEIYRYLEPLYNDYRKIVYRGSSGWSLRYIDEFIDSLLTEELVCDVSLPHIPKRIKLEDLGTLKPRESVLDITLDDDGYDSNDALSEKKFPSKVSGKGEESDNNDKAAIEQKSSSEYFKNYESTKVSLEETVDRISNSDKKRGPGDSGLERTDRYARNSRDERDDNTDHRRDRSERYDSPARRGDSYRDRRDRCSRDRGRDSRDRHRRDSRDRHDYGNRRTENRRQLRDSRDRRDYSRDDRNSRIRERRSRDSRDRRSRRSRDSRGYSRDRRRDRSVSRSFSESSYSRQKRRSETRKRRPEDGEVSDGTKSSRGRRSSSSDSSSSSSSSSSRSRSRSREKISSKLKDSVDKPSLNNDTERTPPREVKRTKSGDKAASRFDKIFRPNKVNKEEEKPKEIAAPEGSVEYWNQMRASLGLKKLKE